MRLCDLFPRIKEASLKKGSPVDKDKAYTLLRFIIRHRHAIGLENDKLMTMYEKCVDVMQYLEAYTQHHKGELDGYEMTFLSLLALTMDIIEADQHTEKTVMIEEEKRPKQMKMWKKGVVFILAFILWVGINRMLLKLCHTTDEQGV